MSEAGPSITKMSMLSLPNEILENILKHTDGCTLLDCMSVCKNWRDFIENTESLWCLMCQKEFTNASRIAKTKCGHNTTWLQIYRNLRAWPNITKCKRSLKKFYNFNKNDTNHALDIDNNILPLKETNGLVLYDMNTLKYIPIALPQRNCYKIASNDYVTAIYTDKGLYIERSVDSKDFATESLLQIDQFALFENFIYFNIKQDIYKCDLKSKNMTPVLIFRSDYNIFGLQYSNGLLHLFTDTGEIMSYRDDKKIYSKVINCPEEWIKRVKHICALDNKNIICYSRDLFYIETVDYKHLFLDFPPISALFFYGDVVLIGTFGGKILLYLLSNQKQSAKPIFEELAVLPDKKFAVTLDVYEKKTGPIIVASTVQEVYIIEVKFYIEVNKRTKVRNNILLYQRLKRLKERMQS